MCNDLQRHMGVAWFLKQTILPVRVVVFGDWLRREEDDVGVVLDLDVSFQLGGIAGGELICWQGRAGPEGGVGNLCKKLG